MRRPKTPKNARGAADSPEERVVRAMERGSYKAARDLAKELYKEDSTEARWRLLLDASIGWAAQMRRGGQAGAASALLGALAARVRSDAERALVAVRMLHGGEWEAAGRLAAAVVEQPARASIDRARGDRAVLLQAAGVDLPDEAWRAGARQVVAALEAVEAGDDARAGAIVAALADVAHFADWRDFITGLVAYYAGEEDIAAWRSLDAQGVPARIVDVLRRGAVPSAPSSNSLAAYLDNPSPGALDEKLGDMQRQCEEGNLSAVLRRAGAVARALPEDLRQRFLRALYWQVVGAGDPKRIKELARGVGGPHEDPELTRLCALMAERDCSACAQGFWKAYEFEVAKLSTVPPALRGLARSLLWLRMADGAGPEAAAVDDPIHGRLLSRRECCRRAVTAAPENRAAHDALLECLRAEHDTAELVAAARAAAARFPEHEQALRILAASAHQEGRLREAVEMQERAWRCRPHDGQLRGALLDYRCALARQMAVAGDLSEVRVLLGAALMGAPPGTEEQALSLRAAVDYRAGNAAAAEEWLERACQTPSSRPSALLSVRMEAAALSLPTRVTRKLDKRYAAALRESDPAAAVALLRVLAVPRTGLPEAWVNTERQRARRYATRVEPAAFGAGELREVCAYLDVLGEARRARTLAVHGERRFPGDPNFPFLLAAHFAAQEQNARSLRRALFRLDRADELARGAAEHAHLLAGIASLRHTVSNALEALGPRSFLDFLSEVGFGPRRRRGSAPAPRPAAETPPRPRARTRASRVDDRQGSLFDVY